jgi:hypothetical protein
MNLYRQSIALFGIVLPILVTALLVGAAFFVKSKIETSYHAKVISFNSHKVTRQAVVSLEKQYAKERTNLTQWTDQLKQEVSIAVPATLQAITATLPKDEIQQNVLVDRQATEGGFGAASAQKSSQINFTIRGTFRTVQRALLELETRMPQLQLQELKITPPASGEAGPVRNLNFQATYTAWEN